MKAYCAFCERNRALCECDTYKPKDLDSSWDYWSSDDYYDEDVSAPDGYYDNWPEDRDDDVVYTPNHYARWSIEPITFIMRNGFEFWRGNIVKYASRAGYKIYDGKDAVESEITDLEKVKRYADMRINQLKGEVEL
jgi:hypothetical protein